MVKPEIFRNSRRKSQTIILQLSYCSKSINKRKKSEQDKISGISTYTLYPACNSLRIRGELPHALSRTFLVS